MLTETTMGWPPAWHQAAGPDGTPVRRWPPVGAPSKEQLDWTEKAIVVGLLILALPYLVSQLLTHPERLSRAAARKHVAT